MKITEKTPINQLIETYPEVTDLLMAYGLHCVNCHFSEFDTIKDGATIHGLSEEEIKMMIKDVKKKVGKKNE